MNNRNPGYGRRTPNPLNVAEGGAEYPSNFGQMAFGSTRRIIQGVQTVFPTMHPINTLYGFVGSPNFIPPTSLPLITHIYNGIVKDE